MLSHTLAALVVALSLPGVVVWHQPSRAEAVGQACDGRRPDGLDQAGTERHRRTAEPTRRRDQAQGQVCAHRRQGPGSR